jgi:hypothetical protein
MELVDRAGWESHDLPHGGLRFLESQQKRQLEPPMADVPAQVDTSAKGRHRSKSAVCCDSTRDREGRRRKRTWFC